MRTIRSGLFAAACLSALCNPARADWDVTIHIDDLHVINDTDGFGKGESDVFVWFCLTEAEPFWEGLAAYGSSPVAANQAPCSHPLVCSTFFAPHFNPTLLRWRVFDLDNFGYEVMNSGAWMLVGDGPWFPTGIGPDATIDMTVSKRPTTCGREYHWVNRVLPDHAQTGATIPVSLKFHVNELVPVDKIALQEFVPTGFDFQSSVPPPTNVTHVNTGEGWDLTQVTWELVAPDTSYFQFSYQVQTPDDPAHKSGYFASQIIENDTLITYSLAGDNDIAIGFDVTGVGEDARPMQPPTLGSPQPNPLSSGSASFEVHLQHDSWVGIRVFDTCGRVIRSLLSRNLSAGHHVATWDGLTDEGEPASNGVYFIRLEIESQGVSEARRIVVSR